MVTKLMEALATAVARRWQRTGSIDTGALADSLGDILSDNSDAMRQLLLDASDDAYVEVTSRDVVRNRVSVSAAMAAWTIYDWVAHEKLSVDPAGEVPSRFYSYGLEMHELVKKILVRCIDECTALIVQVDSADLRTSHLQASIGRMANLIGAEYVTQTRLIMNWIGDPSISDEEDRKSTRLNSSHIQKSRMPSSA